MKEAEEHKTSFTRAGAWLGLIAYILVALLLFLIV